MNSKIGPREAALREMREARARRQSNPFEDAARGRDPVAKEPEKRKIPNVAPQTQPADQASRRKREARDDAAADHRPHRSKRQEAPMASDQRVAPPRVKRGRGRPKATGPREWEIAGISRAEFYRRRRKAEAEKAGK